MASSGELRRQQNEKISERDTLVERKTAVDEIVQRIGTDFEYVITSVNDQIGECSWDYQSGLIGMKASVRQDIEDAKEKYEYGDTKLKSCKINLQNESNRCQTRIDILNSEISSLSSQIAQAEYEEEQARKRAEEEAKKAQTGGEEGDG